MRSSATAQRLEGLAVTAHHVYTSGPAFIDHLDRAEPWVTTCAATETCNDAVDNDCDGTIDARDPDCP